MTEFANLFSALDDPHAVAPKPSGPPPFPARHHILVIAFYPMLCGGQTGAEPTWNFSATPSGNSCNPSFLKLETGD